MTILRKPKPIRRRALTAILLGAATLWLVTVTAASPTAEEALSALEEKSSLALGLLRCQLGEGETGMPAALSLVIGQSPYLSGALDEVAELHHRQETDHDEAPAPDAPPKPEELPSAEAPAQDAPIPEEPRDPVTPIVLVDNGVPARTLCPSSPSGYIVAGKAYIRNSSDKSFDASLFDTPQPVHAGEGEGPKVLIYHTHTTESYTMAPGQSYEASGDCRTLDSSCNMVRVGDELAATLEAAGISVLHDTTLHDYPEYSGSYGRSLTTINKILAENPSIVMALDIHRDAISDKDGNPFKVVGSVAGLRAAQMSIIVGTDGGGLEHPGWQDNLRLAAAIQNQMEETYPTLMRPITVRNSRYNQHVLPGALLIEMGAAGNSLEEALLSARLMGGAIAEVIK